MILENKLGITSALVEFIIKRIKRHGALVIIFIMIFGAKAMPPRLQRL